MAQPRPSVARQPSVIGRAASATVSGAGAPKKGKNLQALLGAGFDEKAVKKDKNFEDRQNTIKLGYRVPELIDDNEEVETVKLYQAHKEMPDVFVARYSEDGEGTAGSDVLMNASHFQLVLELKNISLGTADPVELYVALYSVTKRRFITEEFLLKVDGEGRPQGGKTANKCVFVDLLPIDAASALKAVIRAVRVGEMVAGGKKKGDVNIVRRPHSVSVIDLDPQLLQGLSPRLREQSQQAKVIVPAAEQNFASLHEQIIQNADQFTPPKNTGITYALALHGGRMNNVEQPQEEKKGKSTGKAGFASNFAVDTIKPLPKDVQELTLIDKSGWVPIRPGEQRNCMYVTLQSGDFLQGRKSSAKNIQVKVSLRNDKDFTPLDKSIARGKGPTVEWVNELSSFIYYHNNAPVWNERFIVRLPAKDTDFDKVHLFFEFAHASSGKGSEPFSFSYLRLTDDKTKALLSDKTYSLPVLEFTKKTKERQDPYLTLDKAAMDKRVTKERFAVNIMAQTNQGSPDPDINRVLNWDKASPLDLLGSLKNLSIKPTRVLMFYLERLVGSLFEIITSFQYAPSDDDKADDGGSRKSVAGGKKGPQAAIPPKVINTVLRIFKIATQAVPYDFNGVGDKKPKPPKQRKTVADEDYGLEEKDDGGGWASMRPSEDTEHGPAVLAAYIDRVFSERKVHGLFLKAVRSMLSWVVSEEAQDFRTPMDAEKFDNKEAKEGSSEAIYQDLLNLVASFKYVMQLIFKSFYFDTRSGAASLTASKFRSALRGLLDDVKAVMAASGPSWVLPLQRSLLDSFFAFSLDLHKNSVLSPLRQTIAITDLIASVHPGEAGSEDSAQLAVRKLQLLSDVLTQQEHTREGVCGTIVARTALSQLHRHLGPGRSPSERWMALRILMDLLPLLAASSSAEKKEDRKKKGDETTTDDDSDDDDKGRRKGKKSISGSSGGKDGRAYLQIMTDKDAGPTSKDKDREAELLKEQENDRKLLQKQAGSTIVPLVDFLQDLLKARSDNTLNNITNQLLPSLKEQSSHLIPDAAATLLALGAPEYRFLDPVKFDEMVSAMRKEEGGREKEASFLQNLFDVAQRLVAASAFNKYWILLRLKEIRFCIQVIQWTSARLCQYWLSGAAFDASVWRAHAVLSARSLLCDELNAETLQPEPKREFVQARFPDLRVDVVQQIKLTWFFLGPRQYELIPALVGHLIDLTQSKNASVAELARVMYFNLLQREFDWSGAFQKVQYHTIDSVGRIVHEFGSSSSGLVASFSSFFKTHLKEQFAQPQNAKLQAVGQVFLKDIDELFEYIVALESLPAKKKYEDDRTTACFNLIQFLKNSGKFEMYLKYLMYLCDFHQSLNNMTELGNSLLTYQSLLRWDSDKHLDAVFGYPAQSEVERKIAVCQEAIKAYDEAKNWEMSIKVLQLLCEAYETRLFDYNNLKKCLELQADYWDKITTEDRIFPAYYRVATYGPGFPPEQRGQEWVFKSGDGINPEAVRDFTARMKEKYPEAKVVNSSDLPPAWMLDPESKEAKEAKDYDPKLQYVQITTLIPSSEEEMNHKPPKWAGLSVPARVLKYHQNNNIKVFSYTRVSKEHKAAETSTGKKPNEYRDLWIVKKFLVTAEVMPSLQRRVKVVDRKEVVMSPLETAVFNLTSKNQELRDIIDKVKASSPDKKDALNPLTMQLQGVIDAAVSGGVEKYKEAFFDGSYLKQYPDHAPFISQFKAALSEQLSILKMGLEVFEGKCDKSLQPLHQHLSSTYQQMCTGFRRLLE